MSWACWRQRRRAHFALAAALLWLLGLEVVPNLHLALHDQLAPHTHEGDGAVFAVSFSDTAHRHPDGSLHRPGYRAKRAQRGAGDALSLELEHGAHSLAHHGVAVPPSGLVVVRPLPVDRRATVVAAIAVDRPCSVVLERARARDPPVVASCRM